ncbi:MAG: hypothetical protein HYY18_02330 [Planctomycetes bacterium]|nr:hypothetical protein [Planctomycetota bacterium]
MTAFKFEKGRVKVGKYSLSNLALGEVLATVAVFIVTMVIGWNAYKDARCYYAWNAALIDYASKQPGRASEGLATVMKYRPEFAPPHELAAKMMTDKADYGEARAQYDELVRIDPTNQAAQVGIGVICMREFDKKPGNAALLKQAKDAFTAVEGNTDAKIGLGHYYLRTGDLTGAEKAFNEAERMDRPPSLDGLLDLYIGQGHIAYRRKEYNKAREFAERTRFLNPTNERPLASIAYLQAKRLRELELTREKFILESEQLRAFKDEVFATWSVDPENRAYLKGALIEFLDAYVCLAVRSGHISTAFTEERLIRGIDGTNKRPAFNYIQTLSVSCRSPVLLDEERRQYAAELQAAIDEVFVIFKDTTPRERAILNQMMCVRYILDSMDLGRAFTYIEKSVELMNSGAQADNVLQAAIWRTSAVARDLRSRGMPLPEDRAKELALAITEMETAQGLDSRPEAEEWLRRKKAGR